MNTRVYFITYEFEHPLKGTQRSWIRYVIHDPKGFFLAAAFEKMVATLKQDIDNAPLLITSITELTAAPDGAR